MFKTLYRSCTNLKYHIFYWSFHQNKFYIAGNLLLPSELHANLSKILNDNTEKAQHPLGVLTCQNRNEWAEQRKYLEETGNKEVLQKIDSAIFNLILDDVSISDDKHKLLKHFLHADGTNRYFIFQFSVIRLHID